MWTLPILKKGSNIFKALYMPKENIGGPGPWATVLICLLQEMVYIAFIFILQLKFLQLLTCHNRTKKNHAVLQYIWPILCSFDMSIIFLTMTHPLYSGMLGGYTGILRLEIWGQAVG